MCISKKSLSKIQRRIKVKQQYSNSNKWWWENDWLEKNKTEKSSKLKEWEKNIVKKREEKCTAIE